VIAYVEQAYPKAKLITYIIQKESSFNPKAKSSSCIGLMQINTKVWFSKNPKYNLIKLGVLRSKEDLRNWKLNIKAGVYILKHYNWNYRRYRGE
jgi:soluble lytic murein transglycosylase-like protein